MFLKSYVKNHRKIRKVLEWSKKKRQGMWVIFVDVSISASSNIVRYFIPIIFRISYQHHNHLVFSHDFPFPEFPTALDFSSSGACGAPDSLLPFRGAFGAPDFLLFISNLKRVPSAPKISLLPKKFPTFPLDNSTNKKNYNSNIFKLTRGRQK